MKTSLAFVHVGDHSETHLERAQKGFIDTHHSTRIIELSTIIWCGEERHQLSLRKELVSVFNDL